MATRGRPKKWQGAPPPSRKGQHVYITKITVRQVKHLTELLGTPSKPATMAHVVELAVEDYYLKIMDRFLDRRKRLAYIQEQQEAQNDDEGVL